MPTPESPVRQRARPGPKGPHKFKPLLAAKVLRLVRSGISKAKAADLSGCSREAIRLWALRGREDKKAGKETAYTRFFGDLRKALAGTFAPHERALVDFARYRPWKKKRGKGEKAVSMADERRARIMEKKARLALAVLRVRDPSWKDPVQRHEHSGPDGAPLPPPVAAAAGPTVFGIPVEEMDSEDLAELKKVAARVEARRRERQT